MAVGVDSRCLFSTVRNISGGTKPFSFLPPHGRRLAHEEEYTVFGDIREAMVRVDRATSQRYMQALEDAIQRGDLEIVQTPAPILESQNGTIKMIQLTNAGTLVAVDPCWASSFSASDTDPTPV